MTDLRKEFRDLKVANDELRTMIKDLDKKWMSRE